MSWLNPLQPSPGTQRCQPWPAHHVPGRRDNCPRRSRGL